jgi:predicted HicB family RNase H-like nuclease
MTKRPKLGAVFSADLKTTARSEREATDRPPEPPAQSVPASEKIVQLNVAVPESLRREVKIKALQRGQDMNTAVKELLTAWVRGLDT